MKVPQLRVIDEVAKVHRSIQRQVPMIQDETQKDQKPEEMQMSNKMYVDRGSDCKEGAPHLVRQRQDRQSRSAERPNVSPQV